jgi:hypothetical protein
MKRILMLMLAATATLFLAALSCGAAEQPNPRVLIDISGHPFKGPADAPVTMVVFSDYL